MISLTLFLRGCHLQSLLKPMLPLVGGFAIFSDGYFLKDFHHPMMQTRNHESCLSLTKSEMF